ncbi:MAG: hypothetical protein ABI778_02105 [Ignavibacteriota bacterium]
MRRIFFLAVLLSIFTVNSLSAQVLAEVYRNTGCTNCVGIDQGYDAFLKANPALNVQVVYVQTAIPARNDPFYAISKAAVDARMAAGFYYIQSNPILFVKGFNAGEGADKLNDWKSFTSNPAASTYSGTLTVSAILNGSGKVEFKLHAEGSSGGKQVKPFIMLVESGIKYANTESYGNPPDSIWDNIFRAMIPDPQGGDAFVLSGPTDITIPDYDPTGKPWVLSNCKIIAILQEVTSTNQNHQIDALSIAPINTLGAVRKGINPGSSIGTPIPNPAISSTQIPFQLASPAHVKIVVSDDLGREVETIFNRFTEGSSFASFVPTGLPQGIYYARMFANGAYVGMQKIVFAP